MTNRQPLDDERRVVAARSSGETSSDPPPDLSRSSFNGELKPFAVNSGLKGRRESLAPMRRSPGRGRWRRRAERLDGRASRRAVDRWGSRFAFRPPGSGKVMDPEVR